MSRFAQLEQLIQEARQRGFEVRYEDLGGRGGGVCEFAGKRWLFIDLAVSTEDSWEALNAVLGQLDAREPQQPPASGTHTLNPIRKAG